MSTHRDEPPSAAAALLAELADEGLGPSDVTLEHARRVYERMTPTMSLVRTELTPRVLPETIPDFHTEEPTALIVDGRADPKLLELVRIVHRTLGVPVHVMHLDGNRAMFQQGLADLIRERKVFLSELDAGRIDRDRYTALFTSTGFWEAAISRGKVLVFQLDAVVCPQSPLRLEHFLGYDYIGPAWGRLRPEGIVVDGGNGGLSLRDWPVMMECMRRFPPEHWRGGEDTYYCFHVELVGGRVAKGQASALFGSQFNFHYQSFGAHKIKRMNWLKQVMFVAYCPEAGLILDSNVTAKRVAGAAVRATGLHRVLTPALGWGATPDPRQLEGVEG